MKRSFKLSLAEYLCCCRCWGVGTVICEGIENGCKVLQILLLLNLYCSSLFSLKPYFLGLFGIFYPNESNLIVFRSKQMLFFSSYLRIQLFELDFACKKKAYFI